MLQSVALQPNVDFSHVIHIPKGKVLVVITDISLKEKA